MVQIMFVVLALG